MSDPSEHSRSEKSADAFRTITEVADLLDVQQHVLRFWETKFTQIKPMKRAGGRRYYRPEDVKLLEVIRRLLHQEGFTIRGVQKLLRENGVKTVLDWGEDGVPVPAPEPDVPSKPTPAIDPNALRALRQELQAVRDILDAPIDPSLAE
ncbi:MerR family transcriptional regulator [Pacificispira sp.]|jgi:DNA-binding transcriptional MerR regulator|uniref:MerR family transcriptional regulator n=1 Tax=Pacificispira sp. TaxID=2888761 RepID=UPI003BABFFE1